MQEVQQVQLMQAEIAQLSRQPVPEVTMPSQNWGQAAMPAQGQLAEPNLMPAFQGTWGGLWNGQLQQAPSVATPAVGSWMTGPTQGLQQMPQAYSPMGLAGAQYQIMTGPAFPQNQPVLSYPMLLPQQQGQQMAMH